MNLIQCFVNIFGVWKKKENLLGLVKKFWCNFSILTRFHVEEGAHVFYAAFSAKLFEDLTHTLFYVLFVFFKVLLCKLSLNCSLQLRGLFSEIEELCFCEELFSDFATVGLDLYHLLELLVVNFPVDQSVCAHL